MKKYFGVLFVLAAVLFGSCDQVVEPGIAEIVRNNNSAEPASVGYGMVKVVIGEQSEYSGILRTIYPTEEAGDNEKFTDIVLYGTKEKDAEKYLASWNSPSEMTDYTPIEAGDWTFRLTAKRFGVSFSAAPNVTYTVVANKELRLSFLLKPAGSSTVNTGAIEGEIKIKGSTDWLIGSFSCVIKVAVDDGNEVLANDGKSQTVYPSSESGPFKFTLEEVQAGTRIVRVLIYKEIDNPPKQNLLAIIPFTVVVQAGYTTRMNEILGGTVEGSSVGRPSGTPYTITYYPNYPNNGVDKGVNEPQEVEFFKGDVISNAEDFGFKVSDKSYGVTTKLTATHWADITGKKKYYPGKKYTDITGNITLYAQWKDAVKVTYHSNPLGWTEEEHWPWDSAKGAPVLALDDANFKNIPKEYGQDKFIFLGWDTKADGTGRRYKPGVEFDELPPTELYAQWCKKPEKNGTPGTIDVPITVSSARELNAIFGADGILEGIDDIFAVSIKLDGTIDATGTTLRTYGETFSGTFEAYYNSTAEIKGLTQPLFGTISSHQSGNYTSNINGIKITSSKISGAGAIANINNGKIENCTVEGTAQNHVTVTSINELSNKDDKVGGIVGENNGTIESPTVKYVTITGSGTYVEYVAGVAGYNSSTGTISSAKVQYCTITGGSRAYVNDVAVGIYGNVTISTLTGGNELKGNPSEVTETLTDISRSKPFTYRIFNTPNRNSTGSLKAETDKNSVTVALYEGEKSPDTAEPGSNDKVTAVAYSGRREVTTTKSYTSPKFRGWWDKNLTLIVYASTNNTNVTYTIKLE